MYAVAALPLPGMLLGSDPSAGIGSDDEEDSTEASRGVIAGGCGGLAPRVRWGAETIRGSGRRA